MKKTFRYLSAFALLLSMPLTYSILSPQKADAAQSCSVSYGQGYFGVACSSLNSPNNYYYARVYCKNGSGTLFTSYNGPTRDIRTWQNNTWSFAYCPDHTPYRYSSQIMVRP